MNNPIQTQNTSSQQMLAQLLLNFAEKRILVSTLVEMVAAQFEGNTIYVQDISIPVCNGLLESLRSDDPNIYNKSLKIVDALSTHSAFPKGFSTAAQLRALELLLKQALLPESQNKSVREFAVQKLIEALQAKGVALPQQPPLTLNAKTTSLSEPFVAAAPHSNQNAEYVLSTILNTQSELLKSLTVEHFPVSAISIRDCWKLKNIAVFHGLLSEIDSIKAEFLTAWFFEGSIHTGLNMGMDQHKWRELIRQTLQTPFHTLPILKGLTSAFQRELNLVSNKKSNFFAAQVLFRSQFFLQEMVELNDKITSLNLHRSYFLWALDYCHNGSNQDPLITRSHWQWIKMLSSQQWEDDLSTPPRWVIENALHFSAPVFRLAPQFWLQKHAHSFVQRLYNESLLPSFQENISNVEFIEFLLRCLRKRSPVFALRFETLAALMVLDKLNHHEKKHWELMVSRMKLGRDSKIAPIQIHLQHSKNLSPTVQALSLLLKVCSDLKSS